MTFSQAFALYGPDVEWIATATGIAPPEVDQLINALMDRRYENRIAYARQPAALREGARA